MGFSLDSMIRELEAILEEDQKAAKKVKELARVLAFWKEYAKQCGQLEQAGRAQG